MVLGTREKAFGEQKPASAFWGALRHRNRKILEGGVWPLRTPEKKGTSNVGERLGTDDGTANKKAAAGPKGDTTGKPALAEGGKQGVFKGGGEESPIKKKIAGCT